MTSWKWYMFQYIKKDKCCTTTFIGNFQRNILLANMMHEFSSNVQGVLF